VLSSLMTNSTSWSLADDDSLLSVLRNMSQNFLSRTTQIMDKMDKLALKTSSVQVKLDTANNNFLLLSNIKFIEARVYDDNEDVPDDKHGNNNNDDIQRSEEEIITEALKHGINLIDTAFEKVQVEGSDSESEDEGDKQFYVLQPINKYHVRQLPAVIGTSEWFDDDKIGLAEEEKQTEDAALSESESEDEEMPKQEVKDDSEYSDSEPEADTKSSSVPTAAPDAPKAIPVSNSESVSEFSDDDDDDLFRPKPKEDVHKESEVKVNEPPDVTEEEVPEPETGPKSFAAELSMKLGASKPLPSVTAPEKKKEEADDGGDEDQDVIVKNQKKQGSPNKKSVLFDSSDSDDDLFSSKTVLPKKAVVSKKGPSTNDKPSVESKPSEATVNEKIDKQEENTGKMAAILPPPPRKNVFGNSSDEEDDEDIFADLNISQKPPTLNTEENKKTRNIFSMSDDDSDSDDIFADLTGKLNQKKKTVQKSSPSPSVDIDVKKINKDVVKESIDKSETAIISKINEAKEICQESDSEDNLFADLGGKTSAKSDVGTQPSDIEEKKMDEPLVKEEEGKKSKPTGGVSIFGKFNPTSLLKRKEKSNDEDELDAKSNTEADKIEKDSNFKEDKMENTDDVEQISDKMKVKQINEADEDFTAVSAVETPALTTITKSRPKVSGGRRPPTRAGRRKMEKISVFDDISEETQDNINVEKTENVSNDEPDTPFEKPRMSKAPVGGVSMFGGFNPADLIKKKSKENVDTNSINSRPEDFVDNTQALVEDEHENKEKVQFENPKEENLFMSDEPPPMNVEVVKKSKDIFDDSDDDDDLFKDLITKTSSKPSNSATVGSNMFGFGDDEDDSDDDLFADLLKK